jgi:hypothetical protein
VTAYPDGEPRPTASNLNLQSGKTAPNLVIAKVGADGRIRLYNNAGTVHLIADVMGWISVGIVGTVTKPDTTEVIDPDAVDSIDAQTGDVTVTGTPPAVGEYLFVAPGPEAGDGLLGTVTGTTAGPNGTTTVHTTPARLQDAFPSGEVHGSVDTRALAAGSPVAPTIRNGLRADEHGVLRAHVTASNELCNSFPLSCEVDVRLEGRFVIDVRWGFGTVEELRLVFEFELSSTATITIGGVAKCEVPILPKVYLPPVWGFVPSFQPVMKLEVSGGVTMTRQFGGGFSGGLHFLNGDSRRWRRT